MEDTEILQLFGIPGYTGAFQIGCIARRLTIHAQQRRAFNLAWALHSQDLLVTGSRVGVIGAGFSGLSFAAAAHVLGANVRVFERMQDALHMQRGNDSRFIQPYVYDWPEPGSTYPLTELPFLNWFAGQAGTVVQQVLRQWNRLGVQPTYGHSAQAIRTVGAELEIEFEGTTEQFDIVVLAVGYGLETTVPGHLRLSYWRNDGLDQPVLGEQPVQTFLVSGSGDGGLIETLRLKLKDFDHWNFIRSVFTSEPFIAAARDAAPFLSEAAHPNAWADITFPPALIVEIDAQVRTDTRVILNSTDRIFKDDSSLLNRVAVAILLHLDKIELVNGRLLRCIQKDGGEIAVVAGCTNQDIATTQTIVRHGARSELRPLIPPASMDQLLDTWNGLDDETHLVHYRPEFLVDEFMPFCRETSCRVVFRRVGLNAQQTITQIRDDLLATLPLTRTVSSIENGTETWTWNGRTATLHAMTFPHFSDFVIETPSRALLNLLLHEDRHPYQQLALNVTTGADEGSWEPILLDGPHIWLTLEGSGTQRVIRLQTTEPNIDYSMLQAHRIGNRDRFLDMLRHTWTIERMIDFAWRMTAPFSKNFSWK